MRFKFTKAAITTVMIAGAGMSFAAPAYADKAPIYTPWYNNVAVGGYDVVSYHFGKPVEGKSEYRTTYEGAVWQFSNQINMDRFLENPEQYAPQYGGYCAWAVAMDKLAKGDPQHWTLIDDKLYLNFNAKIKTSWEADSQGFIVKADEKWPAILGE